ncbi:MAG TPA: hypothetical protein VIM67_06060 [Terriglobus sp.]|jgi:hypothetical protein
MEHKTADIHHVHASLERDVKPREPLSLWFFVGVLCLGYGLVLTPVGIYELSHPPAVVLANLHAALWWGLLMTIFGAFYTIRFRPGSGR